MSKHTFTRLRSLLNAARATFSTGKDKSQPVAPTETDLSEDWLFESDTAIEATRMQLSRNMKQIADDLSDLRETLALVHGETPFPTEAASLTPCSVVHHDALLFDGEADAPFAPAQEEISGGAGVFLFDDAPTFQDEVQEHHQHAA